MLRQSIGVLVKNIGKNVKIEGKIASIRDHGKMAFLDVSDQSGSIQCFIGKDNETFTDVQTLSPESVVALEGVVKERPEKNKSDDANGGIEFTIKSLKVLARAEELPFDLNSELNIDTNFDYRPITLRRAHERAVFQIQACITQGFREYLTTQKFVEFQAPSIVGGDAEGGAEVFLVEYFDTKASLATSPQLYKQILVGAFERVFCIGNVFRAEKHSTSRHLNEYTSMDFEMGYITNHVDVMDMLENCIRSIVSKMENTMQEACGVLRATLPSMQKERFPIMKLIEAQKILDANFNTACEGEPDLAPEHERMLCEYAQKTFNSEFIFITHYPTAKRPMYAYDDEEDLGYTKSFDLLFRGVEISSGGQRIHLYKTLLEKMRKRFPGTDPEKTFGFYLQAFKYGMPPHGGIGMGLERLTAKMLNLSNVKEAALFPRDKNRIDTRLHE